MKKVIDFKNDKAIQKYADERFNGNFSLAVTSVMTEVAKSSEAYGVGSSRVSDNQNDKLSNFDIFEIGQFVGSDMLSMMGVPNIAVDMMLTGIDSSELINTLSDKGDRDYITCEKMMEAINDIKPMTKTGRTLKINLLALCVHLFQSEADLKKFKEGRGKKELEYRNKIVDNFSYIFPSYNLVGTEIKTDDGLDRIDILAVCIETGRDVVIELKIGCKSAHKQLRSYAYGFDDPILVNITEQDVKNKMKGINYITYEELGVEL